MDNVSGRRQVPVLSGMALREVLALDVIQRARPEIIYGRELLDRIVRWVHTSELAEVAQLLKGGELLLTTGLGLADRGPAGQVTYIHELADHHLTALVLELGWTFATVPEALVAAARERDLALIALHEIVPFVEMTEEIQTRLVHRQVTQLRLDREVQQLLNGVLLRQEGLSGLVGALSSLLGCPVLLETTAGQTVALAGVPEQTEAKTLKANANFQTACVNVLGEPWGMLHLFEPAAASPQLVRSALEHAPTALALSLLRGQQALPLRERLRREFLEDLLEGRFRSRRDLAARAGLLDFRIAPNSSLAAFALGDYAPDDSQIALYAAETAVGEAGGGLVAEIESVVFAIVAAEGSADAQSFANQLLARIDEVLIRRGASRDPRLALGLVVTDIESLCRSLRDARATLALSQELRAPERAVTARGMAADRLIAKLLDDPEMASIIEEEVGALLRHDAEHGSDLVKTLWTYLAHGSSKTTVAKTLHVRRQSLYARLVKIQGLIGDLDDPQRRISLTLALKANEVLQRRGRE